jgi:dolichol-phosphate mannosyltransferase
MVELSVVLATFNEHNNISVLIDALQEQLKGVDAEIIVVDDNSPDKTAEVAEKAGKKYGNVRVIVRKNESGLSTALLRGFEESKGRYILTMDSDLAHDPKVVPRMLSALRNNETDFVIGSRYVKGSTVVGKPFIKSAASRVAQWIALLWLGMAVKDTTNNFRMFPRTMYNDLKGELNPDGNNIMLMEFVYRAAKHGYRIKELPTVYHERTKGVTKLRLGKEIARFAKNIWRIRFR